MFVCVVERSISARLRIDWRRDGALLFVLALIAALITLTPNESREADASGFLTRTFNATGTGATGGSTDNSSGALGSAPSLTGGYYTWTVPSTGRYRIEATGAQGAVRGSYTAGYGATVTSEWNLTAGQVLRVIVGQQGTNGSNGGGGGGASAVIAQSGSPAAILGMAGGGGGAGYNASGKNASTSSSGVSSSGTGGANGAGGGKGYAGGDCGWAGGGGGYSSDGYGGDGSWDGGSSGTINGPGAGRAYVNGGAGSSSLLCNDSVSGAGGFGAAGGGAGHYGGGGGGGYSGGGGGQYAAADANSRGGGGGGSYVNGALTSSIAVSSRTGAGIIVISLLAPAPTTFATATSSPSNVSTLDYSIQWSESVSGLDTSDFTLSGTSSGWSIVSLTGSGSSYTLRISSSGPSSGTVIVTIAQNAVLGSSTSQLGPGGSVSAATMTIDVDRPTASISTSPSSPAAGMTLTFGLSFSESVSGIAASDFSNIGSAVGCVFTPSAASGTSINVVVTQCQEGTLQLQLAAGSVVDAATNTGPAAALTSSIITLQASPLTITAGTKSINYGGSWTDSYTQSGLIGSDTISSATYSYSGTTTLGTSYGPSSTKPTAGGSYTITPSVVLGASNTNRYSVTYQTASLTIARVAQSALTISTTSGTFGSALTLATSGGSGTGAVSYAVSSGSCTASGNTLTLGDAGSSCAVIATKAGDDNYTAVSSVATSITTAKANQATLSVTSITATFGTNLTLSSAGGSGNGAVSYSVVSGTCTISAGILTPGDAGSSCVVKATKATDTNYNEVSSANTTITINKANQSALTVSSTSGTYGVALSLTTSGGSGSGAVTFAVVSGACSVSGSTLTASAAGNTCVVKATKATSTNYNAIDSSDTTITFAKGTQAPLTISTVSAIFGIALNLSTSGGSGTGSVSYVVSTGSCSVLGSILTVGDAGSSCMVVATKAEDDNYNAVSTSATSVATAKATQATLTVTSLTATYGRQLALTTSGGSGNGAVSYSVVSGTCTVAGSSLTPGNAGSSCVIKATKATDTNYNERSSSNATITIVKSAQSGLSITSAHSFVTGSVLPLVASGGQSTGALSWSVTSGICSLNGTNLSASRGGVTCEVEVTRAGDSNYLVHSATETISVQKIQQLLVFKSSAPSSPTVGTTYTVSVESDAFLAPSIAIANSSASVCSIASGVVTFNAVGTCLISASQAGNDVYSSAAASQSVSVVAVPVPTTLPPASGTLSSPEVTVSTTTIPQRLVAAANSTTSTTSTTTTTTTVAPAATADGPNAGVDGEMPELNAGETTVMIRGKQVKVATKTENGIFEMTLPNKVVVRIGASRAGGSSVGVGSDGVLRAYRNSQVAVELSGLVPGTTYTVYMFSTPIELGRGSVSSSGEVTELVTLPRIAEIGSHTLQVNGVGPGGEVVSVSMGIKVEKKQSNTVAATLAIAGAILLALLGGRPIFRRRRRTI